MEKLACAVTGQRPTQFKFKYNENYSLCKKIKRAMLEEFRELYDVYHVREYYVGGALGVDMWAGELILRLKETPGYGDITLNLVLPFLEHDKNWDERSRRRMQFLRLHSEKSIVIGQQDCKESYIRRNCYMVDHAQFLIAVCSEEKNNKGSTLQMVDYARMKHLKLFFIHPETARVIKE